MHVSDAVLSQSVIIKYKGESAVKRCEIQVMFIIDLSYCTLVCSLLCLLHYLQLLQAITELCSAF